MLKKFRKLQGKAQRRIYGLGEDFDAKLAQKKKEVGGLAHKKDFTGHKSIKHDIKL